MITDIIMNQPTDITEQFLNDCVDKFNREQMRLLTDLKGSQTTDDSKDKDIQKQFTLLNSLVSSLLRLRNLKKAIISKANL
jgi:hypothetical protein